MNSTRPGGAWAIIIVCAAVAVASMPLTWISASAGPSGVACALTDMPIACVAIGLTVATMVAGALGALAGRAGGYELAGIAATALALVTGGFALFGESVASVVPQDLLPAAAQRVTLGSGAGAGAWIACAAGVVATVAATAVAREQMLARWGALRARGGVAVLALAGLLAAVFALVQLRQAAWLEITVAHGSRQLDGLVLPWVAPVTLAAGWLLVLGIGLAALGLWELGALTSAAAGWLITACAAITFGAAHALARLHIGEAVGNAHTTGAVRFAFFGGLGVAAAGAALLVQRRTVGP